jgi:hypothetical protein
MKNSHNLAELQQRRNEEEGWVKPQPCVQCGKLIGGAYANHGDAGWTCSDTCMKVQDSQPRYPGHTEESFHKKFNL